ncbi:MAG: DUF1338 domain-containing protein [Zavarzinella sp.]
MTTTTGPHRAIVGNTPQEQLLGELFDELWEIYRTKVDYVRMYETMIQSHQAHFFNDHIAFRTIAHENSYAGIATVSRMFEALGYRSAGTYHFEDKSLSSVHLQHANPKLPKLFISEFRTWEVADEKCRTILTNLVGASAALSIDELHQLAALKEVGQLDPTVKAKMLALLTQVPWQAPEIEDVRYVNKFSQFAAWVMVHGYQVNHFTALINSHGVASLDNIDKTVAALQSVGVPMKTDIEGAPGSKLRQTATEATVVEVGVRNNGTPTTMPWTYAYFELAERNEIIDPTTGNKARFEGFLGPQATNLFDMTRLKQS